ncbi:helix-turn-helix domain-containing protein [Micromonospora marina]|uniref:helix-turn-helix domain-containing protein n=1 Tax=Micromonospora marina TaxID=307120 RepID=UPI003454ED7C
MTALFGVELRRRRQAAGLSLGALAAAIHYSKSHLSKIENGVKPPNVPLARLCDAALGADGELACLVEAPRDDGGRPGSAQYSDASARDASTSGALTAPIPVTRREVCIAGVGGLAALVPALDPAICASYEPAVQGFRALFEHSRQLGRTISPAVVLRLVTVQVQTLRELAASPTSSRRALLTLAGRNAEFAGWMAQEMGDYETAWSWTSLGISFAEAGGDVELPVYGFVRRAGLMLCRDDPTAAAVLAGQATIAGVPAWIRRSALLRQAQAHARAGDGRSCRGALLRAERIPADATGQSLGSRSGPDQLPLVTGWCLYELGLARDSAAVLDEAVPHLPSGAARARIRFGVRRALAHAESGSLGLACSLTEELAASAVAVDSATIRRDLRRLHHTLRRWHRQPEVARVIPLLNVAHRTTIERVEAE